MRISRRNFIISSTALASVSALGGLALWKGRRFSSQVPQTMISPYVATDGQGKTRHFLGAVNLATGDQRFVEVGEEGHSVIRKPSQPDRLIYISQRPGMISYEIDTKSWNVVKEIHAATGKHFYGHGVFTADNKLLLTTENDIETGEGVIVCRDINTYKIVDEFPSFGIGPHELCFLSDKKTIAIANGGDRTHPQYQGKVLNLAEISPSLALVDFEKRALIGKHSIKNKALSFRHLSLNAEDSIVVALRDIRADFVPPGQFEPDSLFYLLKKNGDDLEMPDSRKVAPLMDYHTLSICYHPQLPKFAMTSPIGKRVTFFDANTGKLLKAVRLYAPEGVAATIDGKYFVVSDGDGSIHYFNAKTLVLEHAVEPEMKGAWRNHLNIIS